MNKKRQLKQSILALILILAFTTGYGRVAGNPVDLIVIEKNQHRMTLFRQGVITHIYSIALGRGGLESKTQQGDSRTLEGKYVIDNKNADSAFYRALHISYPNAEDKDRSARLNVKPGGDIMIHGQRNHFGWASFVMQKFDWTAGCVAVTDDEMDEIWQLVPVGTPVEIRS